MHRNVMVLRVCWAAGALAIQLPVASIRCAEADHLQRCQSPDPAFRLPPSHKPCGQRMPASRPHRARAPGLVSRRADLYGEEIKSTHGHQTQKPILHHFYDRGSGGPSRRPEHRGPVRFPVRRPWREIFAETSGRSRVARSAGNRRRSGGFQGTTRQLQQPQLHCGGIPAHHNTAARELQHPQRHCTKVPAHHKTTAAPAATLRGNPSAARHRRGQHPRNHTTHGQSPACSLPCTFLPCPEPTLHYMDYVHVTTFLMRRHGKAAQRRERSGEMESGRRIRPPLHCCPTLHPIYYVRILPAP